MAGTAGSLDIHDLSANRRIAKVSWSNPWGFGSNELRFDVDPEASSSYNIIAGPNKEAVLSKQLERLWQTAVDDMRLALTSTLSHDSQITCSGRHRVSIDDIELVRTIRKSQPLASPTDKAALLYRRLRI
ncbi:hypothetical protein L249_0589 [Ophiocordyceps polyrhachis-furcata BCC 54312]|uniref:Uncharacterized protein n=1 Tax=Ophiocordyceps polyrhachis-furcata BCC 54312 TaxID=1330021 RepID=A0A367LET2_9HYPO|nr:hypothetical protein L249_0589 [Ophiocordyceps polyrhachis-furcata BCC 54312]